MTPSCPFSLFHLHLLRLVAVNPPPTAESRHDPTTRRTTNSFLCRSRSGFGALSRCFPLSRRSACLVLASTFPSTLQLPDLRAAGETRRRLRPSAQGPLSPASLLPNEHTASVLASGTWPRLPPFLVLEPPGWRLETWLQETRPFVLASCPAPKVHCMESANGLACGAMYISKPHMSSELSSRLTYSKVHRRSLSFCFDRPSRPAFSRTITNFRLWEHWEFEGQNLRVPAIELLTWNLPSASAAPPSHSSADSLWLWHHSRPRRPSPLETTSPAALESSTRLCALAPLV